MKITIQILLIQILFFLNISDPKCQLPATNSGNEVKTVQPKIIVIPFTKEGEDIRTILEEDINKRIAITKIKEAFDNRGFTTVDFTAKLKAAQQNQVFNSDNQTDIRSQIIQMSGADIYVQAEVNVQKTNTGNSVTLILTGYEASTGNSLSNKVGTSPKMYVDDVGILASKAVESIADEFLNVMQTKFDDIVVNGKSIMINITFAEGSTFNANSEVGPDGLPLSDVLNEWMDINAYKNNHTPAQNGQTSIFFDDVRIPLKDQATGQNYSPNKFALELFKFLKSLGIASEKYPQGNTINFTIK